jgi:hypothetical protein
LSGGVESLWKHSSSRQNPVKQVIFHSASFVLLAQVMPTNYIIYENNMIHILYTDFIKNIKIDDIE